MPVARRGLPMKIRMTVSLLVAALVSVAASAQRPPSWTTAVDAIVADVATTESSGCAVAVFRDGRIAYERGYGMADLEHECQSLLPVSSTWDRCQNNSRHTLSRVLPPKVPHDGAPLLERGRAHHWSRGRFRTRDRYSFHPAHYVMRSDHRRRGTRVPRGLAARGGSRRRDSR